MCPRFDGVIGHGDVEDVEGEADFGECHEAVLELLLDPCHLGSDVDGPVAAAAFGDGGAGFDVVVVLAVLAGAEVGGVGWVL